MKADTIHKFHLFTGIGEDLDSQPSRTISYHLETLWSSHHNSHNYHPEPPFDGVCNLAADKRSYLLTQFHNLDMVCMFCLLLRNCGLGTEESHTWYCHRERMCNGAHNQRKKSLLFFNAFCIFLQTWSKIPWRLQVYCWCHLELLSRRIWILFLAGFRYYQSWLQATFSDHRPQFWILWRPKFLLSSFHLQAIASEFWLHTWDPPCHFWIEHTGLQLQHHCSESTLGSQWLFLWFWHPQPEEFFRHHINVGFHIYHLESYLILESYE